MWGKYIASHLRLQARSDFALTPLEHNLILLRTLVQFIFQSQEQTLFIFCWIAADEPKPPRIFLGFFFFSFSLSTSCCEKSLNVAASHRDYSGDQSLICTVCTRNLYLVNVYLKCLHHKTKTIVSLCFLFFIYISWFCLHLPKVLWWFQVCFLRLFQAKQLWN